MNPKKQHKSSPDQSDMFEAKNTLLESYGERLAPEDYFDLLFSDMGPDDRIMLVEGGKKFFTVRRDQLFDVAGGHDNIYYCPVQFYDDCKKDILINKVYGIIIDMDHVSLRLAEITLENLDRQMVVPTCVVNSGNGLHLVYILKEPLTVTPRIREMIVRFYFELNRSFPFQVDMHSLGQAYRVVGSLTKSGQTCIAFHVGDLWTIEDLADVIAYEIDISSGKRKGRVVTDKMLNFARDISKGLSIPLPDLDDYDATFEYIAEHKDRYIEQKKPSAKMIRSAKQISKKLNIQLPDITSYSDVHEYIKLHAEEIIFSYDTLDRNGRTKAYWYEWCVEKVKQKTLPGHRYSSLMALAVIAQKTKVPKKILVEDLNAIALFWRNSKDWSDDPFKEENIKDAVRCYDNKRLLHTSKAKLEEWLGWEFKDEKKKRSHRNQKDFLSQLAETKIKRSLIIISNAMKENPNASKAELHRITGLNYKTVLAHYDEAKNMIREKVDLQKS